MKSVLIIGAGSFGKNLAEKLCEMKHEVFALDTDENQIGDILPFVTKAKIGDGTDIDVLSELEPDKFDICFVAIRRSFEDSLQATSLLKELGAKKVVSLAANDVREKFLLKNGADHVIYPEKQLAKWAVMRYTADNVFDYVRLDDKFSMFEIAVPKAWKGKTVSELAVRQKHGINIIGIKKNGVFDASVLPDTVISEDESLLIVGEIKNVRKCIDL